MKRIGIEAQRIFRTKKHGMDLVVLETIRRLIDMQPEGYKFYVFVKPDSDVCIETTGNVEVVPLHATTYPFWEQIALPAACRKHNIDLLHATSNTAPTGITIPLLITLHDIIYLEKKLSGGNLYQRLGNLYRKWIVPKAVKTSKALITVSEFEKKRILEYFGRETPVHVVYNGISPRFFETPFETHLYLIKEKYELPENFIFFLGNDDPKKNLDNVLRAVVKVLEQSGEDLHVVIADYEQASLMKKLKDLKKTSLRSRFVLPGYIKNDDLPSVYRLANLFLYPSLRESFGIPVIEAQACGTPVITSDRASMPEVSGGVAMLVSPEKYEDIASGILRVLEDKTLHKQLSDEGKKNATRFSWTKTAEATLNIYNLLLQKT